MTDKARVVAANGLRLRDSPRDGMTLVVIPRDGEVGILGRETWLRVQYGDQVGFVLSDYVEPTSMSGTASSQTADPGLADNPAAVAAANSSSRIDADELGAAARACTPAVNIVEYPPSPVFRGSPLRIDEEFLDRVKEIEDLAHARGVSVWITSSYREPYAPVSNAIVEPARFSNHHVGHAIDMNLVYQGRLYGSAQFNAFDSLPEAIRGFLQDVCQNGNLRWGGKFSPPDVVHIDDGLNVYNQEVFTAKLDALWGMSSSDQGT